MGFLLSGSMVSYVYTDSFQFFELVKSNSDNELVYNSGDRPVP